MLAIIAATSIVFALGFVAGRMSRQSSRDALNPFPVYSTADLQRMLRDK